MSVRSQAWPGRQAFARGSAAHQLGPQRVQLMFREVNEEIRSMSDHARAEGEFEVVCECTDADCVKTFRVKEDEYERVRHSPSRFLVKPGHVDVCERIVEETVSFFVIEKTGAAALTAISFDPRGGTG